MFSFLFHCTHHHDTAHNNQSFQPSRKMCVFCNRIQFSGWMLEKCSKKATQDKFSFAKPVYSFFLTWRTWRKPAGFILSNKVLFYFWFPNNERFSQLVIVRLRNDWRVQESGSTEMFPLRCALLSLQAFFPPWNSNLSYELVWWLIIMTQFCPSQDVFK